MPRGKNRPLAVEIKGNELVIKIGINTLAFAFDHSEYNQPWDNEKLDFFQTWKISDPKQFAEDVRIAALAEEEDGSSPLSNFLDRACQDAVNEGSVAVEKSGEKCRG